MVLTVADVDDFHYERNCVTKFKYGLGVAGRAFGEVLFQVNS